MEKGRDSDVLHASIAELGAASVAPRRSICGTAMAAQTQGCHASLLHLRNIIWPALHSVAK